ncbi:tail length tape measure protein [Erwinia phage vB_EamP-S6]|uniref:Gp086 n=1 Tax=Erwinia phage vB_EamP-S6 TaxID=1051675 RepID=G0YQH8_9CAUD|nr:tail length tape measure protein [Erwinia phage vB_EamP-S6]AEJ81605.1 gp086 [Erwinia phage vB_EamP-S6]
MTTGAMTDEEILNMSDDDIMNMSDAPVAQAPSEPAAEAAAEQPEPQEPEVEEPEVVEEPEAEQPEVPAKTTTGQENKDPAKPAAQEPAKEPVKDEPAKEVDYKAQYERIMAPFKANGKDIKLDNPDDVIRLMQMGANYTKKMQGLQPHLKLLKMLDNQGLLEEAKLNNLIDLHKRNPAAIQQLVRESGIDPLEIDTSKDPGYVPGNHSVSEQELQFSSILDEVTSTQEGQDIVVAIDKQWDDASKQALYKEPAVLQHLVNQKQSGVFDAIVNEVERQKMLGNLANVPFIQAYNIVGQELHKAGRLPNQAPATTVLETKAAPVKTVANSDKARAASPTKSAPQKVKQELNHLAMSDDDFLKLNNIPV